MLSEKASSESTVFSESTNFYGSQDSSASALFVSQITNLLKKGDRKKTLQQFKQTYLSGYETPEEDAPRKNLQVLVSASDRLK